MSVRMAEGNTNQYRALGLWTRLAWRLYEHLPTSAENLLARWYRYVLPFRNLRIPISIVRGQARVLSSAATVLVAGDESRVECLIGRLFEGPATREPIGTVPLWRLESTLQRLGKSADLTIVRLDRFSSKLFLGRDYLAVPEWIGSTLEMPANLETLTRGNASLRSDLRLVRHNELAPEVSHDEGDFLHFYHAMYVPFIRNRHAGQAFVRNIYWMRRAFRRGGLIWVLKDGQRVCGLLFRTCGRMLKSFSLGTAGGGWQPVAAGGNIATDLFVLQHAQSLGCDVIDLGGSRPLLDDGVLRYKRKWRMRLVEKQDTHSDFLVGWKGLTPPALALLSNLPLIFRDSDGLAALHVIDGETPPGETELRRLVRSIWVPGLRRLYVASTSGWEDIRKGPDHTLLVDPCLSGTLTPRSMLSLAKEGPNLAYPPQGQA